jgi:fermentation-respiration switch protein FrsA (DUF1100 family)
LTSRTCFVAFWVVLVAGCAGGSRPVLYPNEHYQMVGGTEAERDIDACMRRAREHGAGSGRDAALARDTLGGAAIGAASAGAWAAVRGQDAAERAAAGAAAGGAAGLVRGGLRSTGPTTVEKNFVQRCLRERGYDVIGWN